MGKTVTYGIQYKQADSLTEGYKYHISKYNSFLAGNNRIKAAETALELIEWLEADSNELAEEDEHKFTTVMRKSIDLSRKAVRILESINYKSLLPRYSIRIAITKVFFLTVSFFVEHIRA